MKKFYVFFAFVASLALMACSNNAPSSSNQTAQENTAQENTVSKEETTAPKESTAEPKEPEEQKVTVAPKRDKLFYQHLLEYFCSQHYKECFGSLHSARNYKVNSLVLDDVTFIGNNMEGDRIVSWNVNVKGKHSWQGNLKTPHNDWEFEATVYELADNNFKITFTTPEVGWFGKKKKNDVVSATRVVEFSE